MTKQIAGTKIASSEIIDNGNGLYSPGGWGFECGVLPPVASTPERKLGAKGPYQQTGARARTLPPREQHRHGQGMGPVTPGAPQSPLSLLLARCLAALRTRLRLGTLPVFGLSERLLIIACSIR
jgi:hypothetical protein